jgi:hypothetical protein
MRLLSGLFFRSSGWVAILATGLLLAGCKKDAAPPVVAAPQPQTKEAPATPIAEKKAEFGAEVGTETWDPAWDKYVEEALPKEMLADQMGTKVRRFCPRFNKMSEVDRRQFWAYFFQALAGAEAGLKPTTDVRHSQPEVAVKDTVTKRTVRSQGLLQLTYMDSDRYGCDFDWDADKKLPERDPARTILQPKNNLTCGVKILENQVVTQNWPLVSGKSYWGPLHPGWGTNRVLVREMANVPQVCRVDPAAPRKPRVGKVASVGTAAK